MLRYLKEKSVEASPVDVELIQLFEQRAAEFKKIDEYKYSNPVRREYVLLQKWMSSSTEPVPQNSRFFRDWKAAGGFSYRDNVDYLLGWNSLSLVKKIKVLPELTKRYQQWMRPFANNTILISLAMIIQCNQISKDLLQFGVDPNGGFYFVRSMTLLSRETSCSTMNHELVKAMLDKGANPNMLSYAGGICPLHAVIRAKNVPAFESMMAAGADLSMLNYQGVDLAAKAALSPSKEIREVFIKYQDKYAKYELFKEFPHTDDGISFLNDRPEGHAKLLENDGFFNFDNYKEQVNEHDSIGNTALMVVAGMSRALVNQTRRNDMPAACNIERYRERWRDVSTLTNIYLLGSDIHAVNKFGDTALTIASRIYGSYAMIYLLIEALHTSKPEDMEKILAQCGLNKPNPAQIRMVYCEQSTGVNDISSLYERVLALDTEGKPATALSRFVQSDPAVFSQIKADYALVRDQKCIPFEPDYADDEPPVLVGFSGLRLANSQ